MRGLHSILLLSLAGCFAVLPAAEQPRRPGYAPRIGRPSAARAGKALDRLNRMTPEQRRRILENLPPDRRKRVEQRLDQFNSLPVQERQKLREQLERFRDLPPERQEAARRLFRKFNSFPEDRRLLLKEEFRVLQELDPAERGERINSDEFRSKYTLAEQQLLQDYSNLISPPE